MTKKITTALIATLLCGISAACAATRSDKAQIARNLDIFNSLFKELQTFYVDSIDAEKAVNTAIGAMLQELDPYTEYIPQKDQDDFRAMTSGEYAGIGSYIMQRPTGGVYISGPQAGSPAEEAGLRSGDLIMVIDNDTVTSWNQSKVSEHLKGQAGTNVRVTVKRPYVTDSILTFDITRRKIQMSSVPFAGMERGDIGYINLSSFTDKSPDEIREALMEFKAQPQLKGIILDLRGNGGGIMESAVKILGYFLPKGTEVLRTRGKGVLNEKIYRTTTTPIMPDVPLVVLVDGGTASAAEIVSGALQDLDRAVIMGNRSFGKGLVQTSRPVPYDGILKVTTAKYYLPSGRLIQAIDYSHRNADGSVGRIPDSLTTVFTTAHGRQVRDGGGIVPDVTVTYPEISRVTFNVVRDNWAFDYATKYAATHSSIASPTEFEITDSIYEDFKSFIDPEKFNYDKVCETILKQLREAAGVEGYMTDSVSAQFDLLEGMLRHPLQRDLDNNRQLISPYLVREIVDRYYNQAGALQSQLRTDPGVKDAIALLDDPERYRSILSIKK